MKKIFVALLAVVFTSTVNAADIYKIDPTNTSINWTANHFGFANQSGKISDVNGTIILDELNPRNSSVEVLIKTGSIVTGMDKFDSHLKSADFLNSAKYPDAVFKSTSLSIIGQNAKIKGTLTLLGGTRQVIIDARLNKIGINPVNKKKSIGFYGTTTIKRSDFGMNFGVPGISDKVNIAIDLEATYVGADESTQSAVSPSYDSKNASATTQTPSTLGPLEWKILSAKSKLEFKVMQGNSPVSGSFKRFDGRIIFDKDHLTKSSITIEIDTTSVEVAFDEASSTLQSAAWLATSAFPKATFTSNTISLLSDINMLKNFSMPNAYNIPAHDDFKMNPKMSFRANGMLNIKGKSMPASVQFTIDEYTKTTAHATGKATIKRSLFDIGDKNSSKSKGLQDDVVITFAIAAER